MADDATTDDGCGCCRPETKSQDNVVRDLLARREALEDRLRRLELVTAGTGTAPR